MLLLHQGSKVEESKSKPIIQSSICLFLLSFLFSDNIIDETITRDQRATKIKNKTQNYAETLPNCYKTIQPVVFKIIDVDYVKAAFTRKTNNVVTLQ